MFGKFEDRHFIKMLTVKLSVYINFVIFNNYSKFSEKIVLFNDNSVLSHLFSLIRNQNISHQCK